MLDKGKRLYALTIITIIVCISVFFIGIEGVTKPALPDNDLHYNYGVIKEVDGIWYKTTYFGFEDDYQSISVYYGSELFDYVMDNVEVGDFVIVVWKWANSRAETFDGYITVKWLDHLVCNGDVVFP